MATFAPPKRGVAYTTYVALVDQSNTKKFKAAPTIASGDWKLSKDGGALSNLATLPTVEPSGGVMVKIVLSASEMTADNVTVVGIDASGDEWCSLVLQLHTVANQFDDLTTADDIPTTAEIWDHTSRTLTQTAAQVADAITGSNLTITRAATFEVTLTGLSIPASWAAIYFTAKRNLGSADSASVLQILESNPAGGSDGLLTLNRAAAADATWGALTVDQGAGTIVIELSDDATALLSSDTYNYDLKALLDDDTSIVLTQASVTISNTSTETV